MTGKGGKFLAALGLAGALALGGCAYDDGYGYGGVAVGTGYYGGGDYYPSGYYNGWYDNYYYPGSGYYVYDRGGRRQRWTDGQRRYWEGRQLERRNNPGDGPRYGEWRGRGRDAQDGRWQGRDGQPGNGSWSNRPRPPQGADGTVGRGRWRGSADRPPMNGGPGRGYRDRPQVDTTPGAGQQMNQPRSQREGFRSRSSVRPDRSSQPRGAEPFQRTRPD